MNHFHDPHKQIGYLQQSLSSDKKPLGLFLGAGCPVAVKLDDQKQSPLIPDIAGITESIRKTLAKCKECGPLLNIIENHFKADGHNNANIEDILSHIRGLRVVAGKEKIRELTAEDLDKLDGRICSLIQELANKNLPHTKTPYHQMASWVDDVGRDMPVEIFTTNYDLLVEQAFEDCRVPYFDGFAGTYKPFFDLRAMEEDKFPSRWARLWKLHGSINWYQIEGKGVFRGATTEEKGSRRVIHPSHLKYDESRRMPYLAMIDRLRAFLKQPTSALVICGYSFRDKHLNEVIWQGLQSTPTAIAFAFLYGEIENYPEAVKIANRRSNLSLLAKDGAVISGREAKWSEKDSEAISMNTTDWIKWLPSDPIQPNGKKKAQFSLGDFAIFGQFLSELVGTFSSKVSDAK